MKTRNQFFGLIAMAIIAIIALSMTGCKGDDPKENDPVLCKCPNGTEHLVGQPCCDETDCKCVVYYGTLPDTTIKIYKGEGVTDEQMTSAVQNVIAEYVANITEFEELIDSFQKTISFIYVVTGTEVKRNGNIIEVGCNATSTDIGTLLLMIALGMD
jgi:hypothetical protein